MPKRTLIDDTIGWVNYVQETGIKKQTVAIDWQAEYQKKDKELIHLKAQHNCDYHGLKSKFQRLREEYAAEKKRADEAEEALTAYTEETVPQGEYDSLMKKYAQRTKDYNEMRERVKIAEKREQQLKDFVYMVLDADEGHIRWKEHAKRTIERVYGADGA